MITWWYVVLLCSTLTYFVVCFGLIAPGVVGDVSWRVEGRKESSMFGVCACCDCGCCLMLFLVLACSVLLVVCWRFTAVVVVVVVVVWFLLLLQQPEQHLLTAKAEAGFAMQVCKFGPSRGAGVDIVEARLFPVANFPRCAIRLFFRSAVALSCFGMCHREATFWWFPDGWRPPICLISASRIHLDFWHV